jgi:hypothetical protein
MAQKKLQQQNNQKGRGYRPCLKTPKKEFMMIYTNNYNIPESIEKAVINDAYQKEGRFSVTELIKPPQMRILEKRYESQITTDVSDGLWRLLGQSVHYILEQGELEEHISEERLGINVSGVKVTGKIDLYSGTEQKVIDYKVTSVWSFMFGNKPEWEAQLNLYKLLYETAGFPVNSLEIHAILRDWHQSKVNGSGYPQIPFKKITVLMWNREKTLSYLQERVSLHLESEKLVDEELPECTAQEKWERAGKIALMKKGRKSAVKLFDEMAFAEEALETARSTKKGIFYLEERPGERIRCARYCNARNFCYQYRRETVN